ncbi:PP2C family protein-serine/threonine phosphatase [Streptomyces sp. NPDC058374]|uniref:PP2C family protein-serine/threonine phosphatase n=1 Tax=unclassified Streptomyces TaxID=2593676 RepID=UPI003648B903
MAGGAEFPGGVRADGLPAALSDPVRLTAVRATGLLDTGPEPVFEDLAALAARLTGAGRAFVTLVDEERSYWKSCVGVDVTDGRENPVRESFCYFLVGFAGGPFTVEDAPHDPRTRDHPAVGPMKIGAWAGYPLLGPEGEVLGSFCVIDESPRVWTEADRATLATLARSASAEIHLRQSLAASQQAHRLSADLARTLQQGLLPPALRPVPGVDAAAAYVPASISSRHAVAVGGDFYDLFHASGPYFGAVLGDVCGKGVEAAQVTSMARYTLRADAGEVLSPALLLTRLNSAMITQEAPLFLTAVHTTFRRTGAGVAGRVCLAGHPPPLVRRADGRVREVGTPGTLLGVLDDVGLGDTRFRLSPGDLLLLYSDGAYEARPAPGAPLATAREPFGEADLHATLAATRGLDAATTVDRIIAALAAHHGGWASDDIALLALRVPERD